MGLGSVLRVVGGLKFAQWGGVSAQDSQRLLNSNQSTHSAVAIDVIDGATGSTELYQLGLYRLLIISARSSAYESPLLATDSAVSFGHGRGMPLGDLVAVVRQHGTDRLDTATQATTCSRRSALSWMKFTISEGRSNSAPNKVAAAFKMALARLGSVTARRNRLCSANSSEVCRCRRSAPGDPLTGGLRQCPLRADHRTG